jgi:divalent metal cation (Fe/Co/Zn/Cd) transporter
MANVRSGGTVRFGHTELPAEQREALRKAVRIEWATMGFLVVTTTMVFLVLGNSQAMKAAWIEDLLSFLPPISFLLATRIIRKPPSKDHTYGYHRSMNKADWMTAMRRWPVWPGSGLACGGRTTLRR